MGSFPKPLNPSAPTKHLCLPELFNIPLKASQIPDYLCHATSKDRADGDSKNYGAWKIEKAMHCFVHTDEVSRDSSTDWGKSRSRFASYGTWHRVETHIYASYVEASIQVNLRALFEI